MPVGEPAAIKRRQSSEQAQLRSPRNHHVERLVHRRGGSLQQADRHRVAALGKFEDARRIAAELAGFGEPCEIDDVARVVVELGKNGIRHARALMYAVIGKQALLQQRVTDACAAAVISDREPQPPT